jgi:para-nitrobenzyl esterase
VGVACIALLWCQAALAEGPPQLVRAETQLGSVEGEALGPVNAFRGLPFATPPVGPLRFRAPQPPLPWTGVRSALDMGPACPQLLDADPTENSEAVMSEDCLTLNVWTPRIDSAKRPVLFFIHGGAFVVGASRNTFYDGRHLAARGDAVVVTINYRLGAWGFLALNSFGDGYQQSANAGLLDQIAALKWVQANIAKFGGDPGNVTIFGESAGATSVGCLLAMPEARGLFSKAILESGLPSGRTGMPLNQKSGIAQAFLKLAGAHSPAELSKKSMRDLLDAQERLFATTTDLGTFGPSIDGTVLKQRPFDVVTTGRGAPVPILIGTTAEEMRYFSTAEDIGIEQKPRALLLKQLQAAVGTRAVQVLDTYQRLYPKWGDAVVQIASDAYMRIPSIQLADKVSAHQPVFLYLFTYRSNSTYKNFGSAHAMELPFVFGTVNSPEVVVFTGRDPNRYALAGKVMDSWVAFARHGDPSLPGGPAWPRYDPKTRPTMELGTPLRLVLNPLSEQLNIWGESAPSVDQARQLLEVNH